MQAAESCDPWKQILPMKRHKFYRNQILSQTFDLDVVPRQIIAPAEVLSPPQDYHL
jgi:hypothetical protein